MKILGVLLRYFAYLFHLFLALAVGGIAIVALLSGFNDLHVGRLPFPAASLPVWLLILAVFGVVASLMGLLRNARVLFFVYATLALVLILWAFWLSNYFFDSPAEATRALWITIGAVLAFLGAVAQFRKEKGRL